ncbi:ABC transporter permease [Parabacteroides sp. PF5-6]|uniref:ABC transporter permease n=1 Tax=Parabacteroides sp. PF5-6 TaxID=1742403 RepID=UPI002406D80A|nr:ABC transporter permease [Parabacteroides sp. PF5-6]MDF9831091.1 putative ABC transport system permease protein [Parabacteroides sp. PF5-6]
MMDQLIVLFRTLFKRGRSNVIKIISLGVGLAMGLVLIAKVYLEQSYDDFFPDGDRIFQLATNAEREGEDEEAREYPQVSGGIAPGMRMEIPEVEVATRFTWIYYTPTVFFTVDDNHKYKGRFILADSCLFDVFPRPMLAGDAKEVLATPMHALVPRSIAERMGGVSTVVGRVIQLENHPGKNVTIGGVFEDMPLNSHLNYEVILSLPSIASFTWDGRDNWMGNDRYIGYVKLRPGVTPEDIAPSIVRMQEKNQPMEKLREIFVDFSYRLNPLLELHKGTPEIKRMFKLLSLLAFALIFTAVMNYILIVISSLVNRSKEMAVNKCYGASDGSIYRKMLLETLIDLLASLVVAVILILAFQSKIEDLLSATLDMLFSWRACMFLLGVCVVVFFVAGLVPGYLYSRVPIASAFRNYRENKRFWKLGLLFVQFVATGFLIALLVVIGRQYTYMINDDPGYEYKDLAYVTLGGIEDDMRQKALDEIGRLSEVSAVSSCWQLPLHWASGNNVMLPGNDNDLFNIADYYFVSNGYHELMEIPVVEGRTFTEDIPSSREVMVSRRFLEKISAHADWSDGAIGKDFALTEHSRNSNDTYKICGVYEDFRMGAIGHEDPRASVMFYRSEPAEVILIRFHQMTAENIQAVTDVLSQLLPNKEIQVYSYPNELMSLYTDSRRYRDSLMAGGIVALIIALIGLMGYTNDEMNRRRKETAVRKVNGARVRDILYLFVRDISRIAVPALILGCGVAAYVASRWQQQFSEKTSLSFVLYLICGVFVLTVIMGVVSLNCYRGATANPAESVKSE